MPPLLNLDCLDCRAVIDYLTVAYPEKHPAVLPLLAGRPKWHRPKGASASELTVHDPSPKDVALLVGKLGNPLLMKLELSVDFSPKKTVNDADREALLSDTFVALAARFRPEDMTPWGYGLRGGLSRAGQKPLPFHKRLPKPDEELIYGGRGNYLQSKLYLKRVDQGVPLPPNEHRVRMELTMRRGALMTEFALDRLDDLVGYPYRATFTKHFRVVAGPRLRLNRPLDPKEQDKRERKMNWAWAKAGVGKFAVAPDLPPDTILMDAKQIRARASEQLPWDRYVLMRHQGANEKIGSAFRNLERRMR